MDSTWSDSQVCRPVFPKMSRPEIIKDDSRPAVPSVSSGPWTIEYLPVKALGCQMYVLFVCVEYRCICMYVYV
jgi:hypothetical protein